MGGATGGRFAWGRRRSPRAPPLLASTRPFALACPKGEFSIGSVTPAPVPVDPLRHPEHMALDHALNVHFNAYVLVYEERHRRLRVVVRKSVARYLDCGRLGT